MAALTPTGSLSFLLLQLLSLGWCQFSPYVLEKCSTCGESRKDLTPLLMATYSNSNTEVLTCPNQIRFELLKRVLCVDAREDWAVRLKQCLDDKDYRRCQKKVRPATAHAPAPVTTRSAGAASTPALVLNANTTTATEMATRPTSTRENPHHTKNDEYKITLEPVDDAASETNNDALAGEGLQDDLKNSAPSLPTDKMKHLTIAVLSLLAVVFALVGLVTYLICRKKAQQKQYKEVNQTLDTESL